MADVFNIAGRVHSTSQEEVVTTTDEILDSTQEKKQSQVNQEVSDELTLHTNRINALTEQNYVTVQATQSTTAADIPTLINATGDGEQTNTIYRVGCWDGSAFDASAYSEYAWNGTAYVQMNVRTAVGEIFDISEYNASGGDPATYTDLASALLAVPSDVQRGGMTVKFIQRTQTGVDGNNDPVYSYEYVQWRLTATEWSTIESDWQGVDDEPKPGSRNLLESGGAADFYGSYVENSEYVEVHTDNEGRILWGVKTDGNFYFGAGCPQQVKEYLESKISELQLTSVPDILTFLGNIEGTTLQALLAGKADLSALNEKVDKETGKSLIDENVAESVEFIENPYYIDVKTDSNDRILEGIKKDGTKVINVPIEVPTATQATIDSPDFIQAIIDNDEKLIEGITPNGEKHISKFDDETENMIKGLVESGDSKAGVISISLLDADFNSPVPVTITGTKGDENAKYEFELPISDDAFNIRFKFRITENLLNQNKDAVIANISGAEVTAKSIPLSQHQETGTYDDTPYTDNWQATDGGICFNKNSMDSLVDNRNLGGQAFSVQYVGSGSVVSLQNDGSGLILTVDGVSTTYSFVDYENVSELYEALKANTDLSLQYIALDLRTCDELAKFPAISLKDTVHTGVNISDISEQVDAAPFYLYYAVSDKWQQVEIFKLNGSIYSVCDGNVKIITDTLHSNKLTLGGNCSVLFKDLIVHTDTQYDAEYKSGAVISSVNPYIVVFECHGMANMPTSEITTATTEDGMNSLTPDTMEYFFSDLEKKGYLPVSIEDVAAFYTCGSPLPKRCYTLIFDDFRFPICMDNAFRCVYSRHNAKPALALITDREATIMHNGTSITKEKAVAICKNAGFSLVSHTKQHRYNTKISPSEYVSFLTQDIYDADDKLVNGSILVYPGGWTNVYMHDVMDYLGFKCGIEIYHYNNTTNLKHNKFMLSRVNIGRLMNPDGTRLSPYTSYTNLIK